MERQLITINTEMFRTDLSNFVSEDKRNEILKRNGKRITVVNRGSSYTGEIDTSIPGSFIPGGGYEPSNEYIVIHAGQKYDGPVHNPWEGCVVSYLTYMETTSILELI